MFYHSNFPKTDPFSEAHPMMPLFWGYGDLAYRWAGAANIANIKTQPNQVYSIYSQNKTRMLSSRFLQHPGSSLYFRSWHSAIPCLRAAGNPCKNTGVLWGKGVNFLFSQTFICPQTRMVTGFLLALFPNGFHCRKIIVTDKSRYRLVF